MKTSHENIIKELNQKILKNSNKNIKIPINDIIIQECFDGEELELINKNHKDEKILLISDTNTHDILGSKLFNNLKNKIDINEFIWKNPINSEKGVEKIKNVSKNFSTIIAVGSGTICDTIKYSTFINKQNFSVFATSPMNAYTSANASLKFNGNRGSFKAHSAKGVYFDLSVISKCPKNLISAGFSDVICRTTAQVDWLLSNILLNTYYNAEPYDLLKLYEDKTIINAKKIIQGDTESLRYLIKLCTFMGLGTMIIGTSHLGSMAEHNISHYIDMFGDNKMSTSHGEQVGIASITISKMQNEILKLNKPPILHKTNVPEEELKKIFGIENYNKIKKNFISKCINNEKAYNLNKFLDKNWQNIQNKIDGVMIPYNKFWECLGSCNALRTPSEGGINEDLYKEAIKYGRFIRDRYTILDFADDCDKLEMYI